MSNPTQYLALYEETTRGTAPGSPSYKFYPVTGKLMPDAKFDDKAIDEFRGASTGLGNSAGSLRRLATSWAYGLEGLFYPGAELGLILKHAFGHINAAQTVDTNAKSKLLYPVILPYGTDMSLASKAIALVPNVDVSGTTKSQVFGGGRISGLEISIKRPDDITVKVDFMGGPWVGAPGQTAVGSVVFPVASSFSSADAKCYIGGGASRTGSAPDFTALAVGTMTQFLPDEITIKFDFGLEDQDIVNGNKGPSKTIRKGKAKATVEFTLDFLDPSTGFSSFDEFTAFVAGIRTNSLMVVLDNGQLIGSSTQNYEAIIDLPLVQVAPATPEVTSDGKQGKVKFKAETLYDATVGYPFALELIDLASTY